MSLTQIRQIQDLLLVQHTQRIIVKVKRQRIAMFFLKRSVVLV
jgi:hypothetical protein